MICSNKCDARTESSEFEGLEKFIVLSDVANDESTRHSKLNSRKGTDELDSMLSSDEETVEGSRVSPDAELIRIP